MKVSPVTKKSADSVVEEREPTADELMPPATEVERLFHQLGLSIHANAVEKGFTGPEPTPEEMAADFVGSEPDFVRDLGEFKRRVADLIRNARATKARDEQTLIVLEHSELSEALEGVRHGNPKSDKIPEFTQVEEELADLVIRVCDHAIERKYRLGAAIVAKCKYNRTRPHKHGGKAF